MPSFIPSRTCSSAAAAAADFISFWFIVIARICRWLHDQDAEAKRKPALRALAASPKPRYTPSPAQEKSMPTNTSARTIVFDLDGTLADTVHDLIPVLNRTTASVGLAAIPASDVGHVVGHGARAMIRRAFEYHHTALTDDVQDSLLAVFLDDYAENLAVHSVLFPGALAAVDALIADGWICAVCTNKMERFARDLLDRLGVADRFATVTGGDTFNVRKPDPFHLQETIRLAGGDPANAVMVGDTITDIATAKAAKLPVIAVDFGYSEQHVSTLEPDVIISHFDELTPDLARKLSRANKMEYSE
jgi:phosphoglycolate phosphatase